ncbi:MAG: efflux RND transporter permease subunit [bacterium]
MTGFWKFFLDKRQFTLLLIFVLILGGIYAAVRIPKESAPEVQIPVGIVTTILPGASAEDTERLVTNKIEDSVLGIERVSKVTSTSGAGLSSVTVEFDASADIDKSIQLLKDAVDKAKPDLPAEVEDPSVTDVNFADQPILIASVSGDLAPAELTTLGETLKDELSRVSGVSRVALSGTRAREVQVVVEQAKLRQYGLSLSDVTNAIRASGIASPIGSITVRGVEYSVRLEAGITDTSAVEGVAFSGPGGTPLHVRDVARVVDGLENPSTFSRVSSAGSPSAPALTVSVFKSRGGNILATGSAVKEKLAALESSTLSGTKTVITYDAAHDVQKDLTELTRTGIETVILVMLMLFATLGWRESLVAAVSIPLSFLISFIGMAAAGNTINFVSLFALILAIGILVDSGIVVVEAIHTRLIKSGSRMQAAVAAIREYAWPLIAGTMTTVAVFIPLFFLSGVTGKFIASIPFTVIFVLLASIFVALGIVPLLATFLVKPELSPLEAAQERYNEAAKRWYEGFLRRILGNRKYENRFIAAMIGLFIVALLLPMFGAVKVIFFPGSDSDLVYLSVELPQGSELAATDLSVREVEEILYKDPNIASFVTEVGSGSYFAGGGSGAKLANISINLKTPRDKSSDEILEDLRKELAPVTSAKVTVSSPEGGPPTGTPVVITFSGNDLAALTTATEAAERVLADIPGATNVTTSTKDDSAEFILSLDTAKAAELGVSPAVVADTLRTALYGAKATEIRTGKDDIEVRTLLNLNPSYKDPSETTHVTIDAVRGLSVPGAKGPVLLSTIASVDFAAAHAAIRHEDGTRVTTLGSELRASATAADVSTEFEKRMQGVDLPAGVTMKIGGENEDVDQSFAEMFIALLAGVALMLAILVLEFNSFRHALYLLSVIPLSLIGVLGGLALTGSPLSFPSLLGVIALAGVIINHAIILMDSVARIGRESPEHSLQEVVIEAASSRFRPIILTTVVTVVGMIPLSFASALWGPLAFAIMFGLSFSMILTLVLIPVLYHRWPGREVRERYAARG